MEGLTDALQALDVPGRAEVEPPEVHEDDEEEQGGDQQPEVQVRDHGYDGDQVQHDLGRGYRLFCMVWEGGQRLFCMIWEGGNGYSA